MNSDNKHPVHQCNFLAHKSIIALPTFIFVEQSKNNNNKNKRQALLQGKNKYPINKYTKIILNYRTVIQ